MWQRRVNSKCKGCFKILRNGRRLIPGYDNIKMKHKGYGRILREERASGPRGWQRNVTNSLKDAKGRSE